MGGKIVGDMLLPFARADILIAADLRDHLDTAVESRGGIDERSGAIEGIRRDQVHPDVRIVGLEVFKQAQGELLFGGIGGVGSGFGRTLGFGDLLLLERFFLSVPSTELGIGLIEDKAHGNRDFRGDQQEEDQALAPDVAAAFFVTQFIEIGELLGRFGARVVGVVDDQATCCDAMIAQDGFPISIAKFWRLSKSEELHADMASHLTILTTD